MKRKRKTQELHPYSVGVFSFVPDRLKIALLKWWCFAAVYYFIGFGMPHLSAGVLDSIVSLGLVMGLVYAIVISTVVHGIYHEVEISQNYLAVHNRGPFRMLLFIAYSWLQVALVVVTYQMANSFLNMMSDSVEMVVFIGVEPILFGILCLLWDNVLIFILNKLRRKSV